MLHKTDELDRGQPQLGLWRWLLLLPLGYAAPISTSGETLTASPSDLTLRDGLVIRTARGNRRDAFPIDALQAEIVNGRWLPPKAGEAVHRPDGPDLTWETATASKDGTFTNQALRGGYLYIPVHADTDRASLLEAAGHNMVYVNGEPRVGDPYSNGIILLPIWLHAGTNHLLFHVGRGRLTAKLVAPKAAVMFNLSDPTLPDFVAGEKLDGWGAVVVVNATTNCLSNVSLRVSQPRHKSSDTLLPQLAPLSVRKVGFRLDQLSPDRSNRVEFAIALTRKKAGRHEDLDSATLNLRVRKPDQTFRQTFRSDIDGSVQYFAVVPAQPLDQQHPPRALILTTHGAGVEGLGQADAFSPKTWAYVVAPTNRRPYGFDWEDWGRHDAMEVLDLALAKFKTDPSQTYLTGHSMGGHGAWHLGVTFPDRFAAIGPSAGWISFWSYAGARREENPSAIQQLLQRAMNPGDTLALASNYLHHGVYILHGDADDNVPVTQARTMREHLSKFHRDFLYHEQPGAGHWWGGDCVDWPPMLDFFARHKIPADESVRDVNFTTANPGISASSHWATIAAQQWALNNSSVAIRYDPGPRRFVGTTENVARLALNTSHIKPDGPVTVQLDGQRFTNTSASVRAQKIWFRRVGETWSPTDPPASALKGPYRSGPFKEAFANRMIFVFGTRGTPEENEWAFAKARFDAETFWYRGNGSIDVMSDLEFNRVQERDRGVILYGNADNNAAWTSLLADSPVQVRRGVVRIGEREQRSDDLACLFLRPRPGSDRASVGVISGTGLTGLRLTDRVPYFLAGIAFPDCTVFGPDTLTKGSAAVHVAGFFGNDWSVAAGEFAWRE